MALKKLDEQTIKQITILYKNGITPKDIAKQYDILPNSVVRIIRKQGIDREFCARVEEEEAKEIVRLYIGGTNSTIIAKQFEIDPRTVCRVLKKNGIVVKRK
jgi:DNA invertase Pin-like site-specific DNA recombinase